LIGYSLIEELTYETIVWFLKKKFWQWCAELRIYVRLCYYFKAVTLPSSSSTSPYPTMWGRHIMFSPYILFLAVKLPYLLLIRILGLVPICIRTILYDTTWYYYIEHEYKRSYSSYSAAGHLAAQRDKRSNKSDAHLTHQF
jgi:hypothetical protein